MTQKNENETLQFNRKIIKEIINKLSNAIKTVNFDKDKIMNDVIQYLSDEGITDITSIKNGENYTLAQIFIEEEPDNENYFNIIMEITSLMIGNNQKKYDDFLLNQSILHETLFELSCKYPNKKIFKTISYIIKKNRHIIPQLIENRQNVFHVSIKEGKPLALLFYYQLISPYYPNCINCVNHYSNSTPLHIACEYGKTEMVQILMELDAKVNIINSSGQTPLFDAVQSYSIINTKRLLLFGANKNIKNNSNRTPYDIASLNENRKMMELLQQYSIIQKLICCKMEFESLKNRRKDIIFLVFIILLTIFEFVFNLFGIIYPTKKENDLTKCQGSLCIKTQILLGIIYFICVILCLIELKFYLQLRKLKKLQAIEPLINSNEENNKNLSECLKEKDNNENIELQKVFELYNLFDKNDKVCIKCKRRKIKGTIHCAACDVCVDNFDHHCFWVNSCINEKNKKYFFMFFLFNLLYFSIQAGFGIWYLIILSNDGENIMKCLFGSDNEKMKLGLTILLLALVLFTVGVILAVIIPFLYSFYYDYKEEKKLKKNPIDNITISLVGKEEKDVIII